MKQIDNNTLYFGNFVDADLKLIDLHDYLNDINKFINRKRRNKEKNMVRVSCKILHWRCLLSRLALFFMTRF